MLGKAPGVVVCAHCRGQGGAGDCPVCRRAVCDACRADWTTCTERVGRELRLGITARLRAVDPAGRYGLVSRWRGQMKLLDLHRLRWVEPPLSLPLYSALGPHPVGSGIEPALCADERIVWGAWKLGEPDARFDGLRVRELGGESARPISVLEPSTFEVTAPRSLWRDPGGTAIALILSDETVFVADLIAGVEARYDALPGAMIQAVAVVPDRRLLYTATWGKVWVDRMQGDALEPLGGATFARGDVFWLGVGGRHLVAVTGSPLPSHVRVWHLDDDGKPGPQVYRREIISAVGAGTAVSADGRFLALAQRDDSTLLVDLDRNRDTRFHGHTDRVHLAAFVDNDDQLITADYDNRVIMRPRTDDGYDDRVVAVNIT